MMDIDQLVEEYERHEQNVLDFEDARFAEIYIDDETPKRKQRKMKKENFYAE